MEKNKEKYKVLNRQYVNKHNEKTKPKENKQAKTKPKENKQAENKVKD